MKLLLLLLIVAAGLGAQTYTIKDPTNFFKPYPAGALVFKNGLLLQAGKDYTLVSNGAVFSLAPAAMKTGDVIQVVTPIANPLVPGPSGALQATPAGGLDINTVVVPRLYAANAFSGLNSFTLLQVAPAANAPECATADELGRLWIDPSDPQNTGFKVCLALNGVIGWVAK